MNLLIILSFVSIQICFSLAANQKIVCYWPNWRLFKKAPFNHSPEEIDASLCTHIHYAFHILDANHHVPIDSIGSSQTEIYKRLNALKHKNKNLKLILSLGGGGDDGAKYSKMIASIETRKIFIQNTIKYLHDHSFDGLDIDWEFPHEGDKAKFAKLLEELRTEFDKQSQKLSLSAAVVGGGGTAEHAYDFHALGAHLDYINVMTYDAAGTWAKMTGHHSTFQMCKDVVEWFHQKGILKEKLLMGVPFYGHSFTLKDNKQHKIGAPITGEGKWASNEGDNAFYWEVCDKVKHHGWVKEQSDNGHDPIAYSGNQWVGYDDPNQAYQKSKWTKENGYGGILIWEITQDDWHKNCCNVSYPMLRAINYGLFGTGQNPSTYGYSALGHARDSRQVSLESE